MKKFSLKDIGLVVLAGILLFAGYECGTRRAKCPPTSEQAVNEIIKEVIKNDTVYKWLEAELPTPDTVIEYVIVERAPAVPTITHQGTPVFTAQYVKQPVKLLSYPDTIYHKDYTLAYNILAYGPVADFSYSINPNSFLQINNFTEAVDPRRWLFYAGFLAGSNINFDENRFQVNAGAFRTKDRMAYGFEYSYEPGSKIHLAGLKIGLRW